MPAEFEAEDFAGYIGRLLGESPARLPRYLMYLSPAEGR